MQESWTVHPELIPEESRIADPPGRRVPLVAWPVGELPPPPLPERRSRPALTLLVVAGGLVLIALVAAGGYFRSHR